MYNLAAAEAHVGQREHALAELKDLSSAGPIYDFNADDEFATLRGSPGFTAVLRQVERNRKPVARAVPVSTLPERDLLPEDIAYDPQTRRFPIGSVTQSKIVTADGRVFARPDWPVTALRVDAGCRILWAATVQNGVKPERVVLFSAGLSRQEVLEANTPGHGRTDARHAGWRCFLLIANTGWDAYEDDGKKKPESAPVESQIRKIALGGR